MSWGGCCSRYGVGAVLIGHCAGVHVGGFLLGTVGPCAGRHFVAVSWRAVGAFQARAVLLALSRVPCRSFLLNTISPCAGRPFISFSNGEKEPKQRKRLQTPASSERPRSTPPVVRK